jgi:hypothetical protein
MDCSGKKLHHKKEVPTIEAELQRAAPSQANNECGGDFKFLFGHATFGAVSTPAIRRNTLS